MNKKRFEKGLYKGLAAVLIVNNLVPFTTLKVNALDSDNQNINLSELNQTPKNNEIDMNGSFEDTFKSTSPDKDLWVENIKPRNWEMSTYKDFASTMVGEMTADAKSGDKAVKITLDKSVGFFKSVTTSSPQIQGGKQYKLSGWIKGEELRREDTTSTSHSPIFVKAEQLDGTNKVLETVNLGKLSGTFDWTSFDNSFTANKDAVRLRIVVQFDSGLNSGTSGTVYIDDFKLEELTPAPISISLSEQSLKVKPGQSGKLTYTIEPVDASKESVIWESSDESVVEVKDGVFTSKKNGVATITAKIENYPDLKAECNIEVADKVEIDRVEFEKELISIDESKHYVVKEKVYPEYTTDSYTLEIENSQIATIEEGIVKGINPGTTRVIAKANDGRELGSFQLVVEIYKEDTYDTLLNKIYDSLIPNKLISAEDKEVVDSIVKFADNYWNTMNKDQSKNYLWSDLDSTTNSNHITKSFERLREMAKAYLLEGSELKGNSELIKDVLYGLDWLITNRYNEDTYYNNWWDWQIGTPQRLNDTLVMIKDYLTNEELERYGQVIDHFVPNARDQWSPRENPISSDGANRLDMCQVVIYKALLVKDGAKVQEASNDLLQELEYVTKVEKPADQNGIYEDGSLIQHDAIPYTGTYGAILVSGIGKMNYILSGTEWAIPEENVEMIYDVIKKSFEPLMYKGLIMDMVNGRSISRSKWQDIENGEGVIKSIVKYFIPAASPAEANRLKGVVKYWVESNDAKNIVETTTDLEFRAMLKQILKDETVKSSGELLGHYNYSIMDRVVHRRSGFVYGISKYSDRTYMYEAMNKENIKGYHTADGMTYLYNGDVEQYSKGFWPTVDPKRLAGTTVDTVELYDEAGGSKVVNGNDWVGGSVIDDNYGISGMYLDKTNPKEKDEKYKMDLKAKKSWFMFDDEIVALGSDIDSTKGRTVETIVENRKISEAGNEVFTVDGSKTIENIGDSNVKEEVNWAHIKGNKENTDIGYYFPEKANINVLRDHRVGNWNDINGTEASKEVENNFVTMWIDHGVDPNNEKYSYVLLPNKSEEEVEEYYKNPDIEILENSENVHAVRENKLNITAANLWEDNQGVDFIKADKKASIMVRENNGTLKIGVSDPTMKNNGTIRVELDKEVGDLISKDDRVTVVEASDKVVLEINVSNTKGATIEAEFKLKEENKIKAPTDIVFENQNKNMVKVSWINPNENNLVKYYEVYVDGKKVKQTDNEKISLKLDENKNYELSVAAVDKQGNKSNMSEVCTIKR